MEVWVRRGPRWGFGRGQLASPETETPSDREPDAWTRKALGWQSEKDSDHWGQRKAWPRVQVSRGPRRSPGEG